jgi:excisionase family DNA binding protein
MTPQEAVYTTDEIAAMLRTTRQVIIREIDSGRLEAFRLGRAYRIKQTALDAFTNGKKGD